MVPYNKIYGLNSENYKRADLEESIKKHWWKYLIGLGLAGGAGYLAYKAFFDKSKGGTKQQDSTAQQPGAQGDTFSVHALLNLDTKKIDSVDWKQVHELAVEAIRELEKEHQNNQKFHSILGSAKSAIGRIITQKGDDELLTNLKYNITKIVNSASREEASEHLKELSKILLSQNILSEAYSKIKDLSDEQHFKILADKINQKIRNNPNFKNLDTNAILKTILGSTIIHHYINEKMKHIPEVKDYVSGFIDNYTPLFFRHLGRHHDLIAKLIVNDKTSSMKRKLRK